MFGVWCLDGRRRARALLVSGVWTVAEGRVRCWCLVSGRAVSGRCLVSGLWGVFSPCETPVFGGVADGKNAAWGALRGRPMIPQFER